MIEFQEFICIAPAMGFEDGRILPERQYRVRINFEEVLDYGDATEEEVINYGGPKTVINYFNGGVRFLKVDFNTFHAIMMKYKASKTRYIIQTKFN